MSAGSEAVRVGAAVRKGGEHSPRPRGSRSLSILPAHRDLYAAFAPNIRAYLLLL